MRAPRRALIFTTLVIASVFLFGGIAGAQDISVSIVSPLRQNEPIIEQQSQLVFQKTIELGGVSQQIQDLLNRKQFLAQQLDSIKQEVSDLNQKLIDKRAAAEAERQRLEALRNMFVYINSYAGDSAGNTYTYGYCTWYVKNRRPDASNSWGNANTWYYSAQVQGWNVGYAPKKGAIATTTGGWLGHVAYVEGVSLDGQYVTVSEMNYEGWNVISSRTVYYTEFRYIYELN
jgi:surface antigen